MPTSPSWKNEAVTPVRKSPLSPSAIRLTPSSGGTLQPLKHAPALPLVASPSSQMRILSKSHTTPDASVVRGLRRDVVELQHFIDQCNHRGPLNGASRALEDALLVIETQPVHAQVVELLRLVKDRARQIDVICRGDAAAAMLSAAYQPFDPVIGPLLAGCKRLVELENDIASSNLTHEMLVTAPDGHTVSAATGNTRATTTGQLDNASNLSMPPSAAVEPLSQQQLLGRQRIAAHASQRTADRAAALRREGDGMGESVASGGKATNAAAPTTPHDADASFHGDASMTSHVSMFSPMASKSHVGAHGSNQWPAWLTSTELVGELTALGIDVGKPKADAADVVELVVRSLLSLAQAQQRRTNNQSPGKPSRGDEPLGDPSRSASAAASASALREEQLRAQLFALSVELNQRDTVIADLHKELEGSRFSPNVAKTLVSVHDAPMSYHVEKQYIKDHQKAQLRILELERDYQQLYTSGNSDRQRASALATQVTTLTSQLRALEADAAKLKVARDEQEELFLGVSRTRQEEARMCAAAVSQLESRVADLSTQLEQSKTSHDVLQGNFEMLFDEWCESQHQCEEAKALRTYFEKELERYQQDYNQTHVAQLELTQRKLLDVWTVADENEAQKTIVGQQLDDATLSIRVLRDESKNLLDRVRASTEWKLLTVKAPEETKQLFARWQAMQSDRERREAAALKSQADRIALYKQRASTEVVTRKAQHAAEVPIVDAEALLREHERCKVPMPVFQPSGFGDFDEDADQSTTGSRISKELRQAFISESSVRLVTFEQFWKELIPGDD